MLARLFVALVALTVSVTPCGAATTPQGAAPARPPGSSVARSARTAGGPQPQPGSRLEMRSGVLFSLRARRRYAAYLRMRLLEMREAGLTRAADVVERRLHVDSLVGRP